ncbi:MAG: UvrD-helicase domain-containing protein [Ignavibacteria bacterium]|nr:UvrD-helicase domain-containing protein [Ignavibacteria bacterium]
MKNNPKKINPQDTFAESLNGIYLVDAGAGTGKTHTIIRRYKNLINAGVHPKDILLITFTKNAAEQMRNDAVTAVYEKDINVTELLEAPVLNFHAYCLRFLKKYGLKAPSIIGIDEMLTGNFNIAEESNYESDLFRKFYLKFRKNTFRKYENIYKSLGSDLNSVLNSIKKLCSVGIFPTDKGWFGSGGEVLKGNSIEFSELFLELNKECIGVRGEKQNEMHNLLKGLKEKIFFDFNCEDKLEGKRVLESLKEEIFHDEMQEELIDFMRDVYFSYIEYMLSKNILNFDFVIMFAYLVLFTDEKIRISSQFEYIMVDEFQDTDEIQFLLLMLLCREVNGSANIGVVGDWKQGIYGFRNTTIENITHFGERLSEYKEILNEDMIRINFNVETEAINKITFEYNYRSSQEILDFSLHTLLCKGTNYDEPDSEFVSKNFSKSLTAIRNLDDISEITFYESVEQDSDSETELILKKISELTNNEKYLIREFEKDGSVKCERRIQYSDICVLSRTNEFGLKLQKEGITKNIPVNFEGGLELFASQQGILLLAWLRVMLNVNSAEGWLPILKNGRK